MCTHVHTRVCVSMCMHTCIWVHVCTVCVCSGGAADLGGAPLPRIPRDVSQEPVSCLSPAHMGEQSSFQLTATHVC